MAQRIIVHIGRHKCGTTSIQRALKARAKTLADRGIYYPPTRDNEPGHHTLARGLVARGRRFGEPRSARRTLYWLRAGRDNESWWRYGVGFAGRSLKLLASQIPGLPDPFPTEQRGGAAATLALSHGDRPEASEAELDAFLNDLRDAPEPVAVISSESLQTCRPEILSDYLSSFDVRVVCYLREQSGYLRSAYAQRVQATRYGGSLEEYFRLFFRADYEKQLTRWSREFGDALLLRRFDRQLLAGEDAVTDFFQHALAMTADEVAALPPVPDENPSISAKVLAFKLRLNREGYRMQPQVYSLLQALEEPGNPPFVLPTHLLNQVQTSYAAANARVAKAFFETDTLFPHSPARAGEHNLVLDEPVFNELLARADELAPGCIEPPG